MDEPRINPQRDHTRSAVRHPYAVEIRHANQDRPLRRSFLSADTAIGWARGGYAAGAVVARVTRRPDGTVLYDGPAAVELPVSEWVAR
jgi:hypothetical protein